MKAEVLLDTAYAIALSSPNDLFHHCAVQLANELKAAGTRLVTTRAILLEIGNALSKQRHRRAGAMLLDSLEADPRVEIISCQKNSTAVLYDCIGSDRIKSGR